jgi:hypothetical protein
LVLQPTRALRTRKQAFKEHLWSLRKADPERWTSRTLAYHFRLPLANVQAMLALQALEEESKDQLESGLLELADDAEEYLDSEYDEPPPPPPPAPARAVAAAAASAEVYYDRAALVAPSALVGLCPAQELALIAPVAARFGGSAPPPPGVGRVEALAAAVCEALGGLTLVVLSLLVGELLGVVAVPPRAAAASAAAKGERYRARRALLHLRLTTEAPA